MINGHKDDKEAQQSCKPKMDQAVKGVFITACLLVVLGGLLWLTMLWRQETNSITSFFAFGVSLLGFFMALGTLGYAKAIKYIPWFVCVFILLFSAYGLYYIIGFRNGLVFDEIAQVFYIIGFAVLLMIAAKLCAQKWLDFRFSQSGNRNQVEFDSTKHAVEAVFWVGVILVAFGALAYLFLPMAEYLFHPMVKDEKNWLTLTTLVLAAAGLVTYWWAAKSNYIKGVQTNEVIASGKRDEMKNTAQLIADASAMLSKSDLEKYAGLAFLYKIADSHDGPLRQEAFELLLDFCANDPDISIFNKMRSKALNYADNIYYKYKTFRFLPIPRLAIKGGEYVKRGAYYSIVKEYINCRIFNMLLDYRSLDCDDVDIEFCTILKGHINGSVCFESCKILFLSSNDLNCNNGYDKIFIKCDFTGCIWFPNVAAGFLTQCYYYTDNPPAQEILNKYSSVLEARNPALRDNSIQVGAQ